MWVSGHVAGWIKQYKFGLRFRCLTHCYHSAADYRVGDRHRRVAAKGGAEIAAASIDHLHRYIELLFEPAKRRGKEIS
jgi:hypothetical protein